MSNKDATLIHQLAEALQGAMVDDLLRYHSTEWIVKARKAQHDAQLYLGERAAQERAQPTDLIAESLAVFDLMLAGCSLQCFGDYQNGDGETIGPRMDSLHDALRAARAAQPQAAIQAPAGDDDHCLKMMCLVEDYMSAVDWHGSQNGEKCDSAIEAIGQYLRKIATPPAPTAQPLTDADISNELERAGVNFQYLTHSRKWTTSGSIDLSKLIGAVRAIERRLAGDTPAGEKA